MGTLIYTIICILLLVLWFGGHEIMHRIDKKTEVIVPVSEYEYTEMEVLKHPDFIGPLCRMVRRCHACNDMKVAHVEMDERGEDGAREVLKQAFRVAPCRCSGTTQSPATGAGVGGA